MRRITLLFGILLVLAACQQSTTDTVPNTPQIRCDDGTLVDSVADCPPPEQTSPTTPTTDEPATDDGEDTATSPEDDGDKALADKLFAGDGSQTSPIPAELESMRERAADKTAKGYAYSYYELFGRSLVDTHFQGARIYVRDELRAITWEDEFQTAIGEPWFNYWVINLETSRSTAWCDEDCPARRTSGNFNPDLEYDLSEPLDWLYALDDVTFKSSRTLDNRNVLIMEGELETEHTTLYIDEFTGVPVQVEIGETTIRYRDLALGVLETVFDIPEE